MNPLACAVLLALSAPARQEPGPAGLRLEPLPFAVRTAEGRTLDVAAGRLAVPENRRDPDSRAITLTFARVASTAPEPGPPIVYLHGGPGGSATGEVRDPGRMSLWAGLLDLGDVILLDQRGCGRSEPELARPLAQPPPPEIFTDPAALESFLVQSGRALAAELDAEGVDLHGYDTEQSADDVAALLDALGARQGRLLGFSYGTHLALATIRRHGERIASAVLIGTEGPDETVKLPSVYDTHLRRLADLVARDPATREHVPDLVALFERALARLEREPLVVDVVQPVSEVEVAVPVGPDGLRYLLVRDIGDSSDLPVIPRLLHTVERGDPSVLRWFVQKRYGADRYPTHLFTVDYASGCTPERLARVEREARSSLFGNAMNAFWLPAVHEVFGLPGLGPDFRAPVVSDVRTLFLSSELDANTPPHQAELARWGFSDATHLVQANGGHEDWSGNAAALAAIHDFFAGEDVAGRDVDRPALRFLPVEGVTGDRTHPSVAR